MEEVYEVDFKIPLVDYEFGQNVNFEVPECAQNVIVFWGQNYSFFL